MRKILILVLTVTFVSLLIPTPVKACSGLLCLIWDGNIDLGVTDRTKINAEANVKRAEIAAKQQTEIADINAKRDAALKQGDLDIERQRQQGLITTQQAETARAQFQASTDAWAAVQIKLLEEHYGTQRDAIEQQTSIGLASIHEAGSTERTRINWSGGLSALVLLLIVGAGLGAMHFRSKMAPQYFIGMPPHHKLGGPYQKEQITDAHFYAPVRKDVDYDFDA